MPRNRGRPTKLTPKVQERVCKAIEQGLPYSEACTLAGIHQATFCNWRNRGETQKQGIFYEFVEAVNHAQAKATEVFVKAVRDSAERGNEEVAETVKFDGSGKMIERTVVTRRSPRDWRAAIAMLERRSPESWGRRVIQHDGIPAGSALPTGPVTLNLIFDDGEGETEGILDENDELAPSTP